MIKGLDTRLLLAIVSLLALGLMMLLSATYHTDFGKGVLSWHIVKQLMFIALASIGMWMLFFESPIFAKINMHFLYNHTYIFYLICVILLLLVLLVGHSANGSTRWLKISSFTLQPSEFAKLAIIFAVAKTIAEQNIRSFGGIIKNILLLLPFIVLILMQTDFGAIFVIGITAFAILFISGINWKFFVVSAIALLLIFIALVFLDPNRFERMIAFYYEQTGQGLQALIGINRGGWFGIGIGASIQKISKLPEIHTDMIFSLIAEELGLIMIIVILGLYTYIYIKGFSIAIHSIKIGNPFHSYVAFGITFWLAFQTLYNILMNIGLAPIKGFTLPLISYGGSSMLVTLIAFAILLRIDAENKGRNG